jgi:hypothetical protein
MREDEAPSPTPRLVLGLLIVAVGVLFTLENLGLARMDDLWPYWPAILIVFGIAKLMAGFERAKGVLWIALGAVLLLPAVSEEIEMQDLVERWPLFLVAFGVYMVWRSFPGPRHRVKRHRVKRPGMPRPGISPPDLPPLPLPEDPVAPRSDAPAAGPPASVFSFLTSVTRSVEGADFRRGDATALLGGCELDLTAAELAAEGAEIEIFAFWGGIGIRVPEDWPVELKVHALMGAAEDNTRRPPGGEHPRARFGVVRAGGEGEDRGGGSRPPRLVVRGFVLMGGIEVRN